MKNILSYIVIAFMFAGCAGLNFGYKDPEAGVDVTCVTKHEVTKCSYKGPDGKEFFVDAPIVKQDVNPTPEPK